MIRSFRFQLALDGGADFQAYQNICNLLLFGERNYKTTFSYENICKTATQRG